MPITGSGFAAIGRLEMLKLLYAHVERLGVTLPFNTELSSLSAPELAGADLVVPANGAFSWVRSENEAKFGTTSTGDRTASSGTAPRSRSTACRSPSAKRRTACSAPTTTATARA